MKQKKIISQNAKELAEAIGLEECHALEWELRYSITNKIIESFRDGNRTVTGIAQRAKTSRARITQILKGNSQGISLDVLLRVLAALGQGIKITYRKAA